MCAPLASRKLLIRTDYIHKKERGKRSHLGYPCSGSMIPDTNVGGNIATINEVSDDQKATFFFS